MRIKNIPKLIVSVAICQSAGVLGSFFTISSISTWYVSLNKPSFTPPNWLFGPAWTTLYLLMGISLYLIWEQKKIKNKELRIKGLKLFFAQLALNSIWSIVFFGKQNIIGGLVIILILWALILLTILKFQKIKKEAAYLLYPYLLWVTFATFLNYSIWILNK